MRIGIANFLCRCRGNLFFKRNYTAHIKKNSKGNFAGGSFCWNRADLIVTVEKVLIIFVNWFELIVKYFALFIWILEGVGVGLWDLNEANTSKAGTYQKCLLLCRYLLSIIITFFSCFNTNFRKKGILIPKWGIWDVSYLLPSYLRAEKKWICWKGDRVLSLRRSLCIFQYFSSLDKKWIFRVK